MNLTAETASSVTTSTAVLTANCTATKGDQSVNPTSVGFRYGTTEELGNTVNCTADSNGNFTTTLEGLTHNTKYYWNAFAVVEGEEFTLDNNRYFTSKEETPVVNVTSISYTDLSDGYAPTSDRAYLSANYTATLAGVDIAPSAVGFLYGTSSTRADATSVTVAGASLTSGSGSFYWWQYNLQPDTKYYWWAWVEVNGKTYYTASKQFTTEAAVSTTPALGKSWLEMPAAMEGTEATVKGHTTSDLFTHTFYYGSETDANRNYTICYNPDELTTYWVAYNLKSSHMGSGRSDEWAYVDSSLIPLEQQANLSSSYKNKPSAGSNNYDRGHLLPSSSRNADLGTMNEQTFLFVNLAPQNATFNQNTWNDLEQAVQGIADSEEIFVVTGTMCQQVNDGNGSFTPERTYDNSGKEIPVPRYFYKVVLKVNKSGSTVTSASTIGFWYTNLTHEGAFESNQISVNQIEEWTGLNFFVNLPDSIEESAESNASWTTFQNF